MVQGFPLVEANAVGIGAVLEEAVYFEVSRPEGSRWWVLRGDVACAWYFGGRRRMRGEFQFSGGKEVWIGGEVGEGAKGGVSGAEG